MLVAVLAFAHTVAGQNPAAGQNADDYRGGWRTDSGNDHLRGRPFPEVNSSRWPVL